MCRVVGYLGRPVALTSILYATDSSLVRQAYSPRMMATFLNLAGFGMAAWDSDSVSPDEPFTYKVTTLPVFDRNLRSLAQKIAPTCLLAHVRGVTYGGDEVVSQQNLHPFRFHDAKVTLAHNGHLREFARMQYDLVDARASRPRSVRRGHDRLGVDLRAAALAARGSVRSARRRRSSPTRRSRRWRSSATFAHATASTRRRPRICSSARGVAWSRRASATTTAGTRTTITCSRPTCRT